MKACVLDAEILMSTSPVRELFWIGFFVGFYAGALIAATGVTTAFMVHSF
jgi:hypothetical protein